MKGNVANSLVNDQKIQPITKVVERGYLYPGPSPYSPWNVPLQLTASSYINRPTVILMGRSVQFEPSHVITFFIIACISPRVTFPHHIVSLDLCFLRLRRTSGSLFSPHGPSSWGLFRKGCFDRSWVLHASFGRLAARRFWSGSPSSLESRHNLRHSFPQRSLVRS